MGFMQEMERTGFTEKAGVVFDYQNASGDLSTARSIAEKLVNSRCSLIFTIATPMSQAVQKAGEGKNIPIIFGAITDPVSAGLVQSMERPGGDITGTSDRWPYEQQMELIREALPKARRVGVVFNPGEANTRYAMERTRAAAKTLGLQLVEAAISGPNDIIEAVESIIRKSDVLYVPADNTAMAGATTIVKTADKYRVPVIAGDPGTFDAGCVVGLGVSYKELGVEAARLAGRILRDKEKPGNLPVVVSSRPKLMVNLKVAGTLNVKLPDGIVSRADVVLGR
jgi:putative ABC transport system substrate-binding protein